MPPESRPRLRPVHWVAVDVAVAVLLAVVDLHAVRGGVLGWLTVLAMTVPLAARRIWPVPVFAVVMVFSALAPQFEVSRDAHLVRALALYPVLLVAPRWIAAAAASVALTTTVLASLAMAEFRMAEAAWSMFNGVLFLTTAGAIAIAVRLQRRFTDSQRRYVAAQREQAAERAVTEERLRIARELHDVLAHGMSVITIQASVARHVFEQRPWEARRALETIEDSSRGSLAELRQMLTALRADPLLDPAPTLSDLEALVARTAAAGVPVEVRSRGEQRPLPAGMELSVYRIIQEALTNVVKHAGPARAEVLLWYQPESLTVEVTDDGGGSVADRRDRGGEPGHGLLGMRERVAVYGGRLDAGPLPPPGRGFRVHARLPLTARRGEGDA
ncbi:sensor histidine kinase [Actinoplanes couchii]|nr:sensor histidine kinase [Actinoplanes couchii]MDR6319337.1 signal transduction histidine kinase [Actinoplanes couchii]